MRRDFLFAGLIWVIVTALAIIGTAAMDPFPTVASEEADLIDEGFVVMTYMAAPVLGLVVAALIYSIIRFRSVGDPVEDGLPIRGTGWVPKAWVGWTTALAVAVMIYPGLTGLASLRSDKSADLVVNITGIRWAWVVEYPESGISITSASELMLPVDRRVRFNVTAPPGEVLHSFWIPAFRMKIDAVPGQVTTVYITPTETGSREEDVAFRLQCAELCGLLHSRMTMAVRVVTGEEFDAWVAEQATTTAASTKAR